MSKVIIDLLEKNGRILRAIYEEKEIPMPDDLEKLSFNNNQALTLFKQQPTAGEFTKRIRTQPYDPKWKHTLIIQTEDRDELCDRLDRAEAINKDLLERLEKTTKYLEIRTKKQSKYSIPRLVDKIIEGNKATIAKAKKERRMRYE